MKDRGFTLIELLIVIVILMIMGGIAVFAADMYQDDGRESNSEPHPVNTDPRQDWVDIGDYLSKRCDGTTMLYHNDYDNSVTASAHHEECAAR